MPGHFWIRIACVGSNELDLGGVSMEAHAVSLLDVLTGAVFEGRGGHLIIRN